MQDWSHVKTEQAYNGWRPITKETYIHPVTQQEVKVDILQGFEDSNVIALDKHGNVIIAKQFRCGPRQVLKEIPGGMIDNNETPEQAAIRELSEEAGYQPGVLEYLGYTFREAWRNGKSHYFLATDCKPLTTGQQLDDFEVIEVELITVAELISNAKSAKMTDSGGVLLAYDRLKQLEEQYEKTN
jgi:ADP-ribose pyrophosphatase